jgi:tetratricopeptide (TPR) repeat protein
MKHILISSALGLSVSFALVLVFRWEPVNCATTHPSTDTSDYGPRHTPNTDSSNSIFARATGDGSVVKQISIAQDAIRSSDESSARSGLERLGWLFVARARESFDENYYRLAEECALQLDARQPGVAAATLLRGHVLHNLHRFKEAEPLARQLVETRGAPFDYGLLGDVLMEMGQLDQAADAYQKMMNLRPDSRALARAAHMRWLRGDISGAVEAMQAAVGAAGNRDTESAAWMNTRLGFYHLAVGHLSFAEEACAAALRLQTNYASAFALLGRVRLAAGEPTEAVELLERAARGHPLPEYQWWLTEALMEAGRFNEARATEAELRRRGAAGDARTFALFLATRHEQPELTVTLMQHELEQRADVFTHDALAWSLTSAGRLREARDHMERALAAGTSDGRLYFHAAVIAAKAGQAETAERYRAAAEKLLHLLLPSERSQLAALSTHLATVHSATSAVAPIPEQTAFISGH